MEKNFNDNSLQNGEKVTLTYTSMYDSLQNGESNPNMYFNEWFFAKWRESNPNMCTISYIKVMHMGKWKENSMKMWNVNLINILISTHTFLQHYDIVYNMIT